MYEKITNLITKLVLECEKEGVTLSLCAVDKNGEAVVAQVGNAAGIEKSIDAQLDNLIKLLLAEFTEDDETEEQPNPTVDPVEFSQKLEKFLQENSLRGDL